MDFVASAEFQDNLSAGMNAATASLLKAADAADSVTASVTKVGPSFTTLLNRADPATVPLAKLTKAQNDLASITATADAAVASGNATVTQRNIVVDAAGAKVQALTAAMAANAPAGAVMIDTHGKAAVAAGGAALAHAGFTREIVILGHEIVSGNYSRIPGSMVVLAERSGELNNIVKALGSAIFGLPGLALAAGAGLVYLGYQAETNQRQLLGLQNSLRATRDDFVSMAAEATNAARAVAGSSGFSLADTKAASQSFVAVPNFTGSQQQLQSLIEEAGNLAVVTGETLPAAAAKLAAAIRDPAKLAQEWADTGSFGMTQALADNVKQMEQSGDKAGAFAADLSALNAHTTGVTNNVTEIQKQIKLLGEAFTSAGSDGKSMADIIGAGMQNVGATVIAQIRSIVETVQGARDLLTNGVSSSAPSQNVLTNPKSGAQGIFQLLPSTAAGLHVDGSDPNGNIVGGLTYLQQLQQKNGGNTDATLKQYGGFVTEDPSKYIGNVGNADTSVLGKSSVQVGSQTMTTAQAIQFWGESLGLDQNTINLGMRVAVVESQGQQFGGSHAGASAGQSSAVIDVSGATPVPPIPPGGAPDANGISNNTLVSDAVAKADKANTTVSAALSAGADVKDYTAALAALASQGDTSSATVVKLQQALGKAQVALQDAVTPADALVQSLARQVAGQDQITAAYANGADAVSHATNLVKAEEDARKLAQVGTEAYYLSVVKLTNQYDQLTASQSRNKAAAAETDQNNQLQYLQAELSTLNESADVRARDLAVLKERQDIEKSFPGLEQDEKDKLVANAAAIADATTQLQTQQQAMQAIGSALTQAFDQVGTAITQAFVNGNGAAVNWGNVTRAVIASVVQEILKMAVVEPVLNSLGGTHQTTLTDAASALGGSSGSSASSLLSTGNSLYSAGKAIFTGGPVSVGVDNFAASYAPSLFSQALPTGISGPVTTGALGSASGLLTGIGAGFAGGSILGGLEQSALGKTGPAATIGAGGGAVAGAIVGSVVPVVGTIIGGIVGGLLGGAGGGLIGPHTASTYSQTGLSLDNGGIQIGATHAQGGASADISALQAQVTELSQFEQAQGITISGQKSYVQIGSNGPNGYQDPTKYADLNTANATGQTALQQYQFASADPTVNNFLSKSSFTNLPALEAAVTQVETFVNTTVPALIALGKSPTADGTFTTQIDNLNASFTQAIANATTLGMSTTDLSTAWAASVKQLTDANSTLYDTQDKGYAARAMTAQATISGNPADSEAAQLYAFDNNAATEQAAFSLQLRTTYGDAITTTQAYADQINALEKTQGLERLAIVTTYNNQVTAAAQAAQDKLSATATTGVTSLAGYVQKLQTGATSPLSTTGQYGLSKSQFNADAASAIGGNYAAYSNIQTYADNFLSASRAQNGSGAAYAADFNRVLDVLTSLASETPDTLTASIAAAQTETQTQALVAAMAAVQGEVAALRQAVNAPSRLK